MEQQHGQVSLISVEHHACLHLDIRVQDCRGRKRRAPEDLGGSEGGAVLPAVRLGRRKASCSRTPSGNIVILVRSLLVALHVVSVDERLDPLLQISRL